jgi:ketosteroid isomerase-like protein
VTPAAPVAAPAVVSAGADGGSKQVDQAVQTWASAWSSKNMNAYLGSYAKGFKPPKGQSRSEWEAERRERIMGKSSISVKVNKLQTSVNGNSATVKFRQDYAADALSTSSRKTLELTKVGERWLIIKESIGG